MTTLRWILLGLCVGVGPACGDDSSASTESSGTDDASGTSPTSSASTTDDTTSADTGSTTATSTATVSTTGDTETESATSGTETGTSSDDSTSSGDTDTSGSGSSSTGDAVCTPIPFTTLTEDAFTGDDGCAGVQDNAVLADDAEAAAHHAAWCATVEQCQFPAPECPDTPNLPDEGEMIVYVFGTDSGCSGFATINDILDCGDTIEVHYTVSGVGMCGAIVHAWASASIPASEADVLFMGG